MSRPADPAPESSICGAIRLEIGCAADSRSGFLRASRIDTPSQGIASPAVPPGDPAASPPARKPPSTHPAATNPRPGNPNPPGAPLTPQQSTPRTPPLAARNAPGPSQPTPTRPAKPIPLHSAEDFRRAADTGGRIPAGNASTPSVTRSSTLTKPTIRQSPAVQWCRASIQHAKHIHPEVEAPKWPSKPSRSPTRRRRGAMLRPRGRTNSRA
jgi:hypothetical protein